MKKILTDAVAVGNATARAIEFRSRNAANFYYPAKPWFIPYRFHLVSSTTMLVSWMRAPCSSTLHGGYASYGVEDGRSRIAVCDRCGGFRKATTSTVSKNYKRTIAAEPSGQELLVLILTTHRRDPRFRPTSKFPTKGSHSPGILMNADSSSDIYFGPKAPAGKESNWIQTVPGQRMDHDLAAVRSVATVVRQDVADQARLQPVK